MQNDGGLYTLTPGRVVLIAGFGYKPAPVELAGRLATASAEPGCGQGSTVAGQRKGMDGASSCWKGFGEGLRVLSQTQSLDTF